MKVWGYRNGGKVWLVLSAKNYSGHVTAGCPYQINKISLVIDLQDKHPRTYIQGQGI